jgi:hypothetical protein
MTTEHGGHVDDDALVSGFARAVLSGGGTRDEGRSAYQVAGRFNLRQLLVRGIERATSVAPLTAITINLTQHLTTLAG